MIKNIEKLLVISALSFFSFSANAAIIDITLETGDRQDTSRLRCYSEVVVRKGKRNQYLPANANGGALEFINHPPNVCRIDFKETVGRFEIEVDMIVNFNASGFAHCRKSFSITNTKTNKIVLQHNEGGTSRGQCGRIRKTLDTSTIPNTILPIQ